MPSGEPFSVRQRQEIERAVRTAEEISGLTFSAYVGTPDAETRPYAERLHAALPDPAHSVLVLVDPAGRHLEIVTGAEAQRQLPDADCALVALTMQTAFAAGDLVGGLCAGLQQLGEHGRRPVTVHTENP